MRIRLCAGVLGIGVERLIHLERQADLAGRHDPRREVGEETAELAPLARIRGREEEVPHSAESAATAAFWSSKSCRMPAAARSVIAFICARSKARCSAVPWISTKRRSLSMTTLKSTSAVE